MTSNNHDLEAVLSAAQHEVVFMGIVPFQIDWNKIAKAWAPKLSASSPFVVTILCESDNWLFSNALTLDSDKAEARYTFKDLKFVRDLVFDLPELLQENGSLLEFNEATKVNKEDKIRIKLVHVPLPLAAVIVDGQCYANAWTFPSPHNTKVIPPEHPWRERVEDLLSTFKDNGYGTKFTAHRRTELLELYDHNRIPRGIYPRDSFYDTDYSQLVVWALVFDRRGRLLIHRRSDNAKDNRGMWDKSVGGHVDYEIDVDTSRAISREVIEELFTNELRKQDFEAWDVSDKEMIYLGEWRPERRKRFPFMEVKQFKKEWAFFRLRDSQHLYSPRSLPNGVTRGLRVISDVYLFVAGPRLVDDALGALQNSDFKLIELSELKKAMEMSLRKEAMPGFEKRDKVPKFTPDLTNIMTGELRDTLTDFANYIKEYIRG